MKKIICYGDSNTFGYNPLDASRYNKNIRWTGLLQLYLGNKYKIIEEGACDRTGFVDNNKGILFSAQKHFPILISEAEQPDIIIIALGTNDLQFVYDIDEETIKYECQKCSIGNCSFCQGTKLSNTCYSCKNYLEPLIRNEKIVSCDYTCKTGEKEKCATCSKENICSSCNDDFMLFKGKCFLDYSFRATYYTDKDNQTIRLIGHPDIYKINKMKINEEIFKNPSSNYTFHFAGNHTVDIQIDISQITSFSNFLILLPI